MFKQVDYSYIKEQNKQNIKTIKHSFLIMIFFKTILHNLTPQWGLLGCLYILILNWSTSNQ